MSKQSTSVTNPNLANLLDLIKNNPHLPIVPMVSSEVVPDDTWAYWMGNWGPAKIDQYLLHKGRMFFKDDDDSFDVLERIHYPRNVDEMTDEEINAAYDALPWIKAIVVYIDASED